MLLLHLKKFGGVNMKKHHKTMIILIVTLVLISVLGLLGANLYSEDKVTSTKTIENYLQGNTVYLELLENKKRIKKLSSDVHLPKESKLNYALEHNILPTKDELLAYVNLQKKICDENQEVKNLIQTVISDLEISEEDYWDVVVFNNAIYNVLEANIGNYYLTTHNKRASFGILDDAPLSTNATPQAPPVNQEDLLEAKAFIDSL
jgi:hypothetical protein